MALVDTITQSNSRGLRGNYKELCQIMTEFLLSPVCIQETPLNYPQALSFPRFVGYHDPFTSILLRRTVSHLCINYTVYI